MSAKKQGRSEDCAGTGTETHYFRAINIQSMNKSTLFGMFAVCALFASCDDGVTEVCDEGNKAVIEIFNNSVCTPDVSVNGDDVATDMGILATQTVEVDAGDIDVEFDLAFISVCTALDTTVTVACGDTVLVEFTGS